MVGFQIAMTLIVLFAVVFLFAWIFRPGSAKKYTEYSKIPLNND